MTSQRVDVVFMGHDHDYERTLPLYADEVVEPGDGTVYITTGGGGADLGSVRAASPPSPRRHSMRCASP